MTTNILLIIAVFLMGFGWGATAMLMNYRHQMKSILNLQYDILVHMKKLMSSNEKTSEKVMAYAELTNISFDAAINENRKIVKGLKTLVDAVTEEMNNGKEKTE